MKQLWKCHNMVRKHSLNAHVNATEHIPDISRGIQNVQKAKETHEMAIYWQQNGYKNSQKTVQTVQMTY